MRISVKNLVGFLLRGGSIDSRFSGTDRAAEGGRIHRRLQKQEGPGYTPEVTLRDTRQWGDLLYRVEGRADGIFFDQEGRVTVDEIKTTAAPLSAIGEDFNLAHWAQGECYAYFYCLQHGLAEAAVRLTYFQVDTEEILRFTRRYSLKEMETFYQGLLEGYAKWARFTARWAQLRAAAAGAMDFPFPAYRPGQRELAVGVYKTAREGGRFFCQAPTGIGKTISTLFPAVKAMGEGRVEKVFYLTSKTTLRTAAEEALERMGEKGMRAKTVTLTAKDKICFLEERACDPESCPYARGYFDRVNEAVFQLLQEGDRFDRAAVEAAARRYELCPFELSLDLSSFCDVVVCDYNYLFDPEAYLRRFFEEGKSDHFFLIDEAHNLPDRAREMYSAALSKRAVLSARKQVTGRHKKLSGALGKVNAALLELGRACVEAPEGRLVQPAPPKELLGLLRRAMEQFEEHLNAHRGQTEGELLTFYFELRFFLKIAELADTCYRCLIFTSGGDVTVKLLCLDPAPFVDAALSRGKGAVLFSATLSPLSYFMEVLGSGEGKKASFPSPFPRENLCLMVEGGVSTRYRDREATLAQVARSIAAFAFARPGNYIAYFPSYQYMRRAAEAFEELGYPAPVLQQPGAGEEEREAFLAAFAAGEPLLAFCVMGGVFAEGVDLPGEQLSGCCIVGVGLPQIGPELELQKAYYDEKNGMGYPYVYRYPGMDKVLQAAGRVIRTDSDRGAVLLIDSRFDTPAYRALFPTHWRGALSVRGPEEIRRQLGRFWSGFDKAGPDVVR